MKIIKETTIITILKMHVFSIIFGKLINNAKVKEKTTTNPSHIKPSFEYAPYCSLVKYSSMTVLLASSSKCDPYGYGCITLLWTTPPELITQTVHAIPSHNH